MHFSSSHDGSSSELDSTALPFPTCAHTVSMENSTLDTAGLDASDFETQDLDPDPDAPNQESSDSDSRDMSGLLACLLA